MKLYGNSQHNIGKTKWRVVIENIVFAKIIGMENLREQVMVNQFMYTAGCRTEQAVHFLQAAKWHFEVRFYTKSCRLINIKLWTCVEIILFCFSSQSALSMFFQESPVQTCRNCSGSSNCRLSVITAFFTFKLLWYMIQNAMKP